MHKIPDNFRDWSLFPATNTIAYYTPVAQFIELSDYSRATLHGALSGNPSDRPHDVLPVFFHEVRHWIDHVSTIWGRERLILFFEAIRAREMNNENEFWRIISYMRAQKADIRGRYYSTIGSSRTFDSKEWRWFAQNSMGKAFNAQGFLDEDSPIVFTRYNWPDGTRACRVPLSVGALLETNAVQFEIEAQISIINTMSEDQRIVEFANISKQWFQQLYNPELGVYSTAVHLVANRLGLDNPVEAYRYSSALASMALNLPKNLFSKLNVPDEISSWGDGNQAALGQFDRGYAYFLMIHHARKGETPDVLIWLDEVVQQAGLPPLQELKVTIHEELNNMGANPNLTPYSERLRNLLDIGTSIYDLLGVTPSLTQLLQNLELFDFCPVYCRDLRWTFLGKNNPLSGEKIAEDWIDQSSQLIQQFTEFADACY